MGSGASVNDNDKARLEAMDVAESARESAMTLPSVAASSAPDSLKIVRHSGHCVYMAPF